MIEPPQTTTTTVPPKVDSCRFQHPSKGLIDLTTLGRTDGTAAYADRLPSIPTGYSMLILLFVSIFIRRYLLIIEYSYNPCKPFSEGSACQNVAACQCEYCNRSIFLSSACYLVTLDGKSSYALGTQASALWNPGAETGGIPSVVYIYGEKTVVVLLQCSTTGTEEFEVLGEDPANVYIFRLTHKCACWDGCSGEGILKKSVDFNYICYRYTFNNCTDNCDTNN